MGGPIEYVPQGPDVDDHAPAALDQRFAQLDSKRGAWTGVAKPGRNIRAQLGTNTDFAPRGHRDKSAGPAAPSGMEVAPVQVEGVPAPARAIDKQIGRVSNRNWKAEQKRPARAASAALGRKPTWEERMAKRKAAKAFQAKKAELIEARREVGRAKRRREQESRELKEKREKEAMVVQRVTNAAKLKNMSRKERQKLVTVDEAQVINPKRRRGE